MRSRHRSLVTPLQQWRPLSTDNLPALFRGFCGTSHAFVSRTGQHQSRGCQACLAFVSLRPPVKGEEKAWQRERWGGLFLGRSYKPTVSARSHGSGTLGGFPDSYSDNVRRCLPGSDFPSPNPPCNPGRPTAQKKQGRCRRPRFDFVWTLIGLVSDYFGTFFLFLGLLTSF